MNCVLEKELFLELSCSKDKFVAVEDAKSVVPFRSIESNLYPRCMTKYAFTCLYSGQTWFAATVVQKNTVSRRYVFHALLTSMTRA